MSKPKQKQWARQQHPAKPGGRRKFFIAFALVLVVGAAAGALLRDAKGGFDALNGRWLRPDGGYVLQIRSVDASGKIDAVYLNPKPINIAKAKADATRDGSTLKVLVELRAPNYPGSTYTLSYDPQQDQLKGIYFQAV